MKKWTLMLVAVVAVVLAGCQQMQRIGYIPGATVGADGMVVFSAEGKSVVTNPDDPLSEVKAEVAAATLAKANLLEVIKGAPITSETNVSDLLYKNSEAELRVEGWLSRAVVTFEPREGRIAPSPIVCATATLTLDKKALMDLMPAQGTLVE